MVALVALRARTRGARTPPILTQPPCRVSLRSEREHGAEDPSTPVGAGMLDKTEAAPRHVGARRRIITFSRCAGTARAVRVQAWSRMGHACKRGREGEAREAEQTCLRWKLIGALCRHAFAVFDAAPMHAVSASRAAPHCRSLPLFASRHAR